MKSLISEEVNKGLVLKETAIPRATSGNVVVKVLTTIIEHNINVFLSDQSPFECPRPFTPGGQVIGRVHELAPDATHLQPGQLVLVDTFFRGRDNPDVQLLWGLSDGFSPASKKLMADNWRHAGFAEYTVVPLENAFPLNERRLCTELGYTIPELLYLQMQIVAYGGFRGIDLQAGERVIVAPATGDYSGAAVGVAVAMGARVLAIGRNIDALRTLQRLYAGRVDVAQVTGDRAADTAALQSFGVVDSYLDISPAQAGKSTHFASCFEALKPYGRASLMGVVTENLAVPYVTLMVKNISVRGQFMYERKDVLGLIKLAESGVLKLGKEVGCEVVGRFRLEEFERALKTAGENHGMGKITVFEP